MLVLTLTLSMAQATDVLPVHRIRFYETGVAWFEREGEVSRNASLPVPTSHLDDALKSMVVLGGDVSLDAITFPSAEAGDAARVSAGLEDGEAIRFYGALRALLGVEVKAVTADSELTGMLLDVQGPLERSASVHQGPSELLMPHYALTLLASDGTLHRLSTDEVRSVKSTDAEVSDRVAHAAENLVANSARRPKELGLQLRRGGSLQLGYVAEAPVWRVSYRIHEPGTERAHLAGWALIHNTTGEDWDRVQVELANGEPDSFLFPLAAPRYADRELRTPPRELATVAQLASSTVDEMWRVERGYTVSGSGGLGSRGSGMGGGGSAMGMGGVGTAGIAGDHGVPIPPVETPSQFVYVVNRPVDLPAHHSALVPMVDEALHTESVVMFASGHTQARSAVWLRNTTQQTLPQGVLSVVQQGGLEGEAQLQRLKPDETQMITVANERDLSLAHTSEVLPEEVENLRYEREQVVVDHVSAMDHQFTVRNRTGSTKPVWVGLRVDGEVQDERRTELDRHSGDTYLVFDAAPGSSGDHVKVGERTARRFAASDVTQAQWVEWLALGLADPSFLRKAAEARGGLDRIDQRLAEIDEELVRAKEQLAGLRTSLAAAEDASAPLTRQASAVEKEMRKLSERSADLKTQRLADAEALTALVAAALSAEQTSAR